MNRYEIGYKAALIGLGITIVCFLLAGIFHARFFSDVAAIGILLGLSSYLFGAFKYAIKMAAGIAKWGWLIMPFPIDLFTFTVAFIYAMILFIFFPIIPARKAYKENCFGDRYK